MKSKIPGSLINYPMAENFQDYLLCDTKGIQNLLWSFRTGKIGHE